MSDFNHFFYSAGKRNANSAEAKNIDIAYFLPAHSRFAWCFQSD